MIAADRVDPVIEGPRLAECGRQDKLPSPLGAFLELVASRRTLSREFELYGQPRSERFPVQTGSPVLNPWC
jgi:hypothetical protein